MDTLTLCIVPHESDPGHWTGRHYALQEASLCLWQFIETCFHTQVLTPEITFMPEIADILHWFILCACIFFTLCFLIFMATVFYSLYDTS
jgi:hypothetical protein